MEDKLRRAFDSVHASPRLKAETRRRVLEALEPSRPRLRVFRPALGLAAACLALLAFLGGYRFYIAPTALISVDITPSLELGVNLFDRVVSVTGYNQDGQELAQQLEVEGLPYTQAVDALLASDTVTRCLAQDGYLSLGVAQSDTAQGQRILDYLSRCTVGMANAHCYGMGMDQAQDAHDLGLSCGKYQAWLELIQYDPELTPEEVSSMTMAQIRQLLEEYSGQSLSEGKGYGQGDSHGHHGKHE